MHVAWPAAENARCSAEGLPPRGGGHIGNEGAWRNELGAQKGLTAARWEQPLVGRKVGNLSSA